MDTSSRSGVTSPMCPAAHKMAGTAPKGMGMPSTAGEQAISFPRGLTRYQWTVFLVVWAGWALDATDFGLYSLVLRPALTELLGGNPSIGDIGRVGGILSMAGLLGWAFGGFIFGILADYIGRVRTLALSILIYSVFTACQGFSDSAFQLGVFRFLGGLGTGGELIVGIPLVAEAFADTFRARVLGVMMTGGAFGSLIGGWIYGLIGAYGWRYVFFTGIVPAVLLFFIRRGMVEPEHFQAVKARRQAAKTNAAASAEDREFLRFVPVQLFTPRNRYSTMVALSFCHGTGRIVTSTGPLIAGLLVGYFGGFTQGAAIMTCFALLSIVAMFLGRETKEAPLPLFEVAADAKQAD